MAIFLDTNVLPLQGSIDSIRFAILPILARECGQEIIVPQLAIEEATRLRCQKIEEDLRSYKSACKRVGAYGEIPEVALPSPEILAEAWRSTLLTKVKVAETLEDFFKEAIYREMQRVKPTREGYGARDAIIWLTVKKAHFEINEISYFVSENTKDFASSDDKSQFHPDLELEIAEFPNKLHYCNSIDSLLNRIATKSNIQITINTIQSSEVIQTAFRKFIQDNLLLREAFPSLPVGKEYIASSIEISSVQLKNVYTYKVENRNIGIVNTNCIANFIVGVLKQATSGGFSKEQFPKEIKLDIRVWLRFEQDECQPSAAEVTTIRISQ